MRFHLSYQLIVWSLVMIALIMAGGFLIISYTYQVQDTNTAIMEANISSERAAQELEIILHGIRAISLNYIIDHDSSWVDQLREKEREFALALERARSSANTEEERLLIRQIGALFSNYEQNLGKALMLQSQGDERTAHTLLVIGSRDLINTIEEKCARLIEINRSSRSYYEERIRSNNDIIRNAMYAFGFGGLVLGGILGWLVARILLNPIYKLVLKVRDAAGSELVEHVKMSPGKELEEIDQHISRLIARINQAHEELRRNQELLEKSSRLAAIGKIAPAIAHEIRNPLTAIKMLIYSMRSEGTVDPGQREDFGVILSEISRMEGFLQDFLRYARPARPDPRNLDLRPMVTEMIHILSPRMKQLGILVTEQWPSDPVTVRADAGQFKQVLMNLMLNAMEAMEGGGILGIMASVGQARVRDRQTAVARLSISDTGTGVAPEVQDSLFDPFVKAKPAGTGLGLSISQRIMELHHGWIEVAPNPGKGSIFTMCFPLQQFSDDAPDPDR